MCAWNVGGHDYDHEGRDPLGKDNPADGDLPGNDQQQSKRTLPMIFLALGLAAILITADWIGLLGYGAWWLIDGIFG